MSQTQERVVDSDRSRRWLSVGAALVATSAFGGAVGLVGGGLSLDGELESRLPWQSPVLGGFALALIVGLPFSVLAWWAWRGDDRTPTASVVVGVVLLGWLLVELAYIRTFSFFHPLYGAVALAFVAAGQQVLTRRDPT